MNGVKAVVYSAGLALIMSFAVLLLGGCLLGFDFAAWPEIPGRIVGALGTIAGVAGAAIGLLIAVREERRVP